MSTHNAPDRFLDHEGARLRWRLEGTGPAIALLHGWALDLDYWDPLAAQLAPRFTLLRFDRCGFGLSAGVPEIHRNVDDLRALLDVAGIDRPILLGMSQGARLAIHFALEHPARVRALVLDGAPVLEAEPDLPLTQYRNLLDTQGLAALQAGIRLHPLMQLQTSEPSAHRLLAHIVARYAGLDLLQPASRRARPPRLGIIAAPTLILNGARDSTARREAGRKLQAEIPGAARAELPCAGHLALLDDPAGYVQAISAFCGPLPP
jgi:pimeloyl-ACP methyl ester carboxylesterase